MKARTASIIFVVAVGVSLFGLLAYLANGDTTWWTIGQGPPPGFTKNWSGAYDAWYVPFGLLFLFLLPLAIAFAFATASHSRSLTVRTERVIRRRL